MLSSPSARRLLLEEGGSESRVVFSNKVDV